MRDTSEGRHATAVGIRGLRRVVYDRDRISRRVEELGAAIDGHYEPGDDLLVLGLLKGSFIFLADLVRTIQRPLHVDFLVASSYGHGMVSTGEVEFLYDPDVTIADRNVVLVEDIVDSGATMTRLVPILEGRKPKSLEVCTLLHKRLPQVKLEPRWVGFDAPPEFLVGYGLDHAEDFRHLPFIGSL
ncbi:MAG: hypoxanthine phosphoribosyltransferase [Gemmatimonadota bacterium]